MLATLYRLRLCVCSRYNNKTYRIDDIDFQANPMTKFKLKNGEETSFVDYYKKVLQAHLGVMPRLVTSYLPAMSHVVQHYDITIMDSKQPLLVSNPKAREIRARGGDSSPILLVPELCTRTGKGWNYVYIVSGHPSVKPFPHFMYSLQ